MLLVQAIPKTKLMIMTCQHQVQPALHIDCQWPELGKVLEVFFYLNHAKVLEMQPTSVFLRIMVDGENNIIQVFQGHPCELKQQIQITLLLLSYVTSILKFRYQDAEDRNWVDEGSISALR